LLIFSTREKLTVKQLKELLRGLQLAMFSKIYNSELRSPTAATIAPDGSSLSRTVYTGSSFYWCDWIFTGKPLGGFTTWI
jgi:hypothetical protein